MTHKDQQELFRLLSLFFEEAEFNKRDFTNKNKSASLIKEKLSKLGRWKNLPRGGVAPKNESQEQMLRRFMFKHKKEIRNDDCPF